MLWVNKGIQTQHYMGLDKLYFSQGSPEIPETFRLGHELDEKTLNSFNYLMINVQRRVAVSFELVIFPRRVFGCYALEVFSICLICC